MMKSIITQSSIILLGFLLAVMLSGVLIYKAEFNMISYGDIAVLLPQNLSIFAVSFLISVVTAVFVWVILGIYTSPISVRGLLLYVCIHVCLQLAVIYFFRIKLTADWEVLYGISKELIQGNINTFMRGGYLYAEPHNIGLTLYFSLLNRISPNTIYLPRMLNVLYSLITIIYLNKILLVLHPTYQKYKNRFFLISLCFLPTIFMANHIYNEVIATMFFLISVYCLIKNIDTMRVVNLLSIAILFSLGNFFRSLGFLFALTSVLFFITMRVSWKKIALFILCVWIGFNLPIWTINMRLYSTRLIPEPIGKNALPVTRWINMGLSKQYFGYWDQGETYRIYAQNASWNKIRANELYMQRIREKIQQYTWKDIASMYYKKLVWLWTEGTYQSVYLGMSHSTPGGYIEKTPISEFFDNNIQNRNWLTLPMYYGNIILLFLIFMLMVRICITREWKLIQKELYFILLFVVFIGFYLLWEVKPRYIYPFYPYLLLLAYLAVLKLFYQDHQK